MVKSTAAIIAKYFTQGEKIRKNASEPTVVKKACQRRLNIPTLGVGVDDMDLVMANTIKKKMAYYSMIDAGIKDKWHNTPLLSSP